jgi:geranylgeranyl pyrophosphate synthase
VVADAISVRGMVGGQVEDLEATGHFDDVNGDLEERLDRIHRHKTGALLKASVELGAILAGVEPSRRTRFVDYGEDLGLAFQIADDILDATAAAVDLGKSPGKDEAAGKLTYVTLYGLDRAQRRLDELERQLTDRAEAIEGPDGNLGALALFVCRRKS